MKKMLLLSLVSFNFLSAYSQNTSPPRESPSTYFNNFQTYVNEKPNLDSALYNVRKLAANPAFHTSATDLVHNSLAQDFTNYARSEEDEEKLARRVKRRALASQIVTRMTQDSSAFLRQNAQPLFIYSQMQDAGNDIKLLAKLTNQFIKTQIDGQDIYKYRAGRYGLMILNLNSKYPELKSISNELNTKLSAKIKAGQVAVTDSSSRAELDKRSWYRYMNASIHFKQAENTADKKQKEKLLRTAFQYSPDLVDKNRQSAYFYDMFQIFGKEKEGFKDDYVKFISAQGDKQQVLQSLLEMALIEPVYKADLMAVHNQQKPGEDFNTYWHNAIDAQAIVAPPVLLDVLGSTSFSTKSLKGEWVVIDFWGTWCGPCRQEHPDLQKFYDSIRDKSKTKISLLTIACRDTEERVNAYIAKNKYTFPVAMSDDIVTKSFKVQGYPTKVLITPSGKYVTIPFGVDWVEFINQYVTEV
jgi:thiol-disulfide isomerase/thioredoxin